jgi:hypothetical protein
MTAFGEAPKNILFGLLAEMQREGKWHELSMRGCGNWLLAFAFKSPIKMSQVNGEFCKSSQKGYKSGLIWRLAGLVEASKWGLILIRVANRFRCVPRPFR